jgi:hypothetical protein
MPCGPGVFFASAFTGFRTNNILFRAPIWALANGTVNTTSQPGVDGGIYNTSTPTITYLYVMNVVESIPATVYDLPTCGVSLLHAGSALCTLTQRSKCVSVPSGTWVPRSAAPLLVTPVCANQRLSSRLSGTVWWIPVILWTKYKSQLTFSTSTVSIQA